MKTKEIKIGLNNIDKAIQNLRYIRATLPIINREFTEESLLWIETRATEYLSQRVGYFAGSAKISKDWKIIPSQAKYGGKAYSLVNNNKVAAYVEFGTGLIGESEPHEKADDLGYEYDVNGHQEKGWNFDVMFNGTWHRFRGFTGYEGKSFLYDAFYDFFYLGEWKKIYQKIYNRYIY